MASQEEGNLRGMYKNSNRILLTCVFLNWNMRSVAIFGLRIVRGHTAQCGVWSGYCIHLENVHKKKTICEVCIRTRTEYLLTCVFFNLNMRSVAMFGLRIVRGHIA